MNKIRRKNLQLLMDQLAMIKAALEELTEEEEEVRDNFPENLQDSERYHKIDEACDNLNSAIYAMDETIEYIELAIE